MLNIKDVNVGYVPYGSVTGMISVLVDIDTDDIKYDSLAEDLKGVEFFSGESLIPDQKNRNFTYPKIGEKLYKDLVDIVVDKGMEDYLNNVLLAKTYMIFRAKITNQDNALFLSSLIDHISKICLEPQMEDFKAYTDFVAANNGEQPQWQPQPPKVVLMMTPSGLIGQDDFYTQFNIIYINLIPEDVVNYFGLSEMLRNPFSVFVTKIKTVDEIKEIVNKYSDPKSGLAIVPERIFVVLDEYNQDIVDVISENNMRLNIIPKGQDYLNM